MPVEWTVPVSEALVERLWLFMHEEDRARRRAAGIPDHATELIVGVFDGLRVEVFADEHPPPHFRVWRAGESANYRISDCGQLNGGLSRYRRAIRRWHTENKRA